MRLVVNGDSSAEEDEEGRASCANHAGSVHAPDGTSGLSGTPHIRKAWCGSKCGYKYMRYAPLQRTIALLVQEGAVANFDQAHSAKEFVHMLFPHTPQTPEEAPDVGVLLNKGSGILVPGGAETADRARCERSIQA